jgi:hypothetical protein
MDQSCHDLKLEALSQYYLILFQNYRLGYSQSINAYFKYIRMFDSKNGAQVSDVWSVKGSTDYKMNILTFKIMSLLERFLSIMPLFSQINSLICWFKHRREGKYNNLYHE